MRAKFIFKMFTSLKTWIRDVLKTGNERTVNIKKNVFYSFLIKGLSVSISYLLFPLAMNYVKPVQYGIWLTIASMVAWINTFDIGLSNGLRNKLANSVALNENQNAVQYISTTYALLCFISLMIFTLVFIIGSYFNWNQLLHLQKSIDYSIWPIIIITLGSFCLQLILQPINVILIATHQSFKSSLILLFGQFFTLIFIYLLTQYTYGSLYSLVTTVSVTPIIVLIFASIYLFNTSLKPFIPRLSSIDFKSAKSLLNIGGALFFIQVGALVLYETDNIIITRTIGPHEVIVFNIAYKYFSIITVAFSIFMTPYWSAFTDAYTKNDFHWIRQSIRKIRILFLYFSLLTLLLYLFANTFYDLWIGKKESVPNALSITMAAYVMLQTWTLIHAYFLNGVQKLRIQLILVISTGVLNIPLSIWLINRFGVSGTVLANVVVMIIINIFITYQSELIIEKKAAGIWNK